MYVMMVVVVCVGGGEGDESMGKLVLVDSLSVSKGTISVDK